MIVSSLGKSLLVQSYTDQMVNTHGVDFGELDYKIEFSWGFFSRRKQYRSFSFKLIIKRLKKWMKLHTFEQAKLSKER